jgi:SAM-dependent methyltransferase
MSDKSMKSSSHSRSPFSLTARAIWRRWVDPALRVRKTLATIPSVIHYFSQWQEYARLPGAEPLLVTDSYPSLFDALDTTPFDPHYFYQAIWAMQKITRQGVGRHIDVGSDVRFVGMLTTHLPVTFVDIRPLHAQVTQLTNAAGSILNLPFANAAIESLSCLHVAEHIGLGRYGDPLNPLGTRQACTELKRVLAPGGRLYFSLPVGRPRVCFNAHRVHAPQQIIEYFAGLELVEFSGIDDSGQLLVNLPPMQLDSAEYSCGLFEFRQIESMI